MFGAEDLLLRNPTGLMPLVVLASIVIMALLFKKDTLRLWPGKQARKSGEVIRIVRRPILTPNEMAFFHTLQGAVGEHYLIFPKVPLATFVEGRAHSPSAQTSFMNQIDKRMDFVLVDPPDLRLHLVVEVDDRTHESEHRRRRDRLVEDVLQRAGIKLVRIPAAHSYDVATLQRQLGLLDDRPDAQKSATSF